MGMGSEAKVRRRTFPSVPFQFVSLFDATGVVGCRWDCDGRIEVESVYRVEEVGLRGFSHNNVHL